MSMNLTVRVDIPISTLFAHTAPEVHITEVLITESLRETCEANHSSCDSACPVYRANGGKVPLEEGAKDKYRECICFKSGREMLAFLKTQHERGMI